MLNPDFKDMLSALIDAQAEFLIVGAYALAAHGYPRATGDLDIWVRPSVDNAKNVWSALQTFGAPVSKLKLEDFSTPEIVYQIGVAPHRIDILTSISGVSFDDAWANRIEIEMDGLSITVLGRHELINNKKATGRPKDLVDVDSLEDDGSESEDI